MHLWGVKICELGCAVQVPYQCSGFVFVKHAKYFLAQLRGDIKKLLKGDRTHGLILLVVAVCSKGVYERPHLGWGIISIDGIFRNKLLYELKRCPPLGFFTSCVGFFFCIHFLKAALCHRMETRGVTSQRSKVITYQEQADFEARSIFHFSSSYVSLIWLISC
jgi:hypothetical protein